MKDSFKKFSITDITTTSAHVSWELSAGIEVTGFNISYYDEKCYTIHDTILLARVRDTYISSQLQEGTPYAVTVLAVYEGHRIGRVMTRVVTKPSGEITTLNSY